MDIKIIPARPEDAPFIGEAITMAIGEELVENLAGKDHTAVEVLDLFTSLARRTDSQYSYLNTLVAIDKDNDDQVAGLIVSYDGALLHPLRKAFFREASEKIGMNLDEFAKDSSEPYDYDIPEEYDETSADEFYLDSLAVFPEYRGRGIARQLLKAASERAHKVGKPAGLLVSKHNPNARRLYESIGFKPIGERPFAGELMTRMSLLSD